MEIDRILPATAGPEARGRLRRAGLLAAILSLGWACGFAPEPGPGSDRAALASSEQHDATATALREGLKAGMENLLPGPTQDERAALRRLYGGAPRLLWVDPDGDLRRAGRDLLDLLDDAEADGLHPPDYGVGRLDSLARAGGEDPSTIARLDVGLSLAAYRYLRDLHVGRVDPRRIGFRIQDQSDEHDFVALLRTAIDDAGIEAAATALTPALPHYRRARAALARYRQLESEWPDQPLPSRIRLEPGQRSRLVPDLWRRLQLIGDLAGQSPSGDSIYRGPIVEGVQRFQARHGLEADGVVGGETLAELNTPLAQRVHQLELLLERLRWLPDLSAGRVVLVNIPMYELFAWDRLGESDRPTLRTGVIVGKALDHETPVFVEEMRYVIFRPYWNVPVSIVRNEILPAARRDEEYLERNRMEIVEGESDAAKVVDGTVRNLERAVERKLRVRQRPGPDNALGLIKFMFPNDLNVYLHGTPARQLFNRARRDFSHGCVRVEDPVALAEWVLRGRPGWDRQRILGAMEQGEDSRRVDLPEPLQVVLYYTTAAVMPDGTVRFARDIYEHDARLDAALHEALTP